MQITSSAREVTRVRWRGRRRVKARHRQGLRRRHPRLRDARPGGARAVLRRCSTSTSATSCRRHDDDVASRARPTETREWCSEQRDRRRRGGVAVDRAEGRLGRPRRDARAPQRPRELAREPRPDLRGHSAHVGRLMRRMPSASTSLRSTLGAVMAAAYLHDLGKMGAFHLTALNSSEYDGHKIAAQKRGDDAHARSSSPCASRGDARGHRADVRALRRQRLPERHVGEGHPARRARPRRRATRTPTSRRTHATRTASRSCPRRPAASSRKYKETIFDPHLVDLFKNMVMGEDIRAQLLVEPLLRSARRPRSRGDHGARATDHRARLRDADGARCRAGDEDPLGVRDRRRRSARSTSPRDDGIALLAEARKHPWGKDMAWVFHTRRQGRAEAQRAFELGVADYVAKPAPTDVFVAKTQGAARPTRLAHWRDGVSFGIAQGDGSARARPGALPRTKDGQLAHSIATRPQARSTSSMGRW